MIETEFKDFCDKANPIAAGLGIEGGHLITEFCNEIKGCDPYYDYFKY